MKIIDAHIHFSNIQSFKDAALKAKIPYNSDALRLMSEDIECFIGMGVTETESGLFPDHKAASPMELDLEVNPDILKTVIGINPHTLDGNLLKIEQRLQENAIGLKIYAGYYHYHVWDKVYHPVYELAKKYQVPVVIHSGDTYSERGLLKYSMPIEVDQLAMMYREVNFIIAHFGDPWIMETAEIISKNSNVYADLSGLIVGDKTEVERFMFQPLFTDHIKRGLIYADNYKKVLFGSDWPLVDLEAYIDFIKSIVDEPFWSDVFYNNAKRLFKL
jgi:predicted TIM-barrel fold metal-dependent hydrolase